MKNANIDFDVIVIGASISGSATASLLARSGVNVALIDRAQFPRTKACGEGLCSLGVSALKRLEFDGALNNIPHTWLKRFVFHRSSGSQSIPMLTWDREKTMAVGFTRRDFDAAFLFQALAHPNVTPVLETTVTICRDECDGVVVETDKGILKAKYVVDASGAICTFSAEGIPDNAASRFGWTWRYTGEFSKPQDAVNIFLHSGYELYATPTGPNSLNISVLIDRIEEPTSKQQFEQSTIERRVFSQMGFVGQPCEKKFGASYLGSSRRYFTSGRRIAVGDACAVLDPISGMGMTHALLSAEQATICIVDALKSGANWESVFASYPAAIYRVVRPLERFTSLVSLSLKRLPDKLSRPIVQTMHLPIVQNTVSAYCRM